MDTWMEVWIEGLMDRWSDGWVKGGSLVWMHNTCPWYEYTLSNDWMDGWIDE